MQIKSSLKSVKPAGVLAQPPKLWPWGGWEACGQGLQVSPLHLQCRFTQRWGASRHSSPNVALTWSLNQGKYPNLGKRLPCQNANSPFQSCWPAGWTIWENKLDPCFQNAGRQQQAEADFPGIYPWKSPEQMVPFRKPSFTGLKSCINRCSGGAPCPKVEKPDPESSLNRLIW